MRIVQALNALDPADAVSGHVLELDAMLRRQGHETAIYSLHAHPEVAHRRRPITELVPAGGDLLLFHWAGCSPLGMVTGFPGRRGLVYHNVTPARFFEEGTETWEFCRRGAEQRSVLPDVFHFAVGISEFSVRELAEAGFEHVRRLPIPWETSGLDAVVPDPQTVSRLADGAVDLLMVGRIARNKGLHHAVRAMDRIRAALDRPVRLHLVGKAGAQAPYTAELRHEIRERGLENEVLLTGKVSPSVLAAYYASADALLVLSEHEGFCVPVVEAMHFDVPVIGTGGTAVPETLGPGGLILDDRAPDTIADAVHRVVTDPGLRERLLAAQREKREEYTRASLEPLFRDVTEWGLSLELPRRAAGYSPRISVVVCTYNRARVLEKCLEALRRIDYPEYEVVVVNGPSTDDTDHVLHRFPDMKRISNPRRNLSVSRNLGIAASAGEIVAFIDDDAIPDPKWLTRLAEAYLDPTVAGAGGVVFYGDGSSTQFRYGTIDRLGLPDALRDEPGEWNVPRAERYNIVMGTNSSFRRSALEEVGGFDENYEYFHDEADLCVRLIQAGYRIVHVEDAPVWHEFEKSHIRRAPRDTNWRVITKNGIYFYFRVNDVWRRKPWDALRPLRVALINAGMVTRWFLGGEIGLPVYLRAAGRWCVGLVEGYLKGLFRAPRRILGARRDPQGSRFLEQSGPVLRYGGRSLSVALLSQQYAPDPCDGIGAYTVQLARGLVARGHRVTVLAEGKGLRTAWDHGVRVLRLPPAAVPAGVPLGYRVVRTNVARSLAIHDALVELSRRGELDLVEAPIWDAPAFALTVSKPAPLVLRLNTPMLIAAETQGWPVTDDLRMAGEMEWKVLHAADAVIDTSGTIVDTLREKYGQEPEPGRVHRMPFGVELPSDPPDPEPDPSELRFLFVGRLEPRKGIDVLLRAIPDVVRGCPRARFLIAGEVPGGGRPEALRAELPADVAPRVEMLGRVDDATRDALYRDCHVFVAPSRYESFGLVYIEAMAWGKPAVAAAIGGATQVVTDGETGRLVPPGDARALAEALLGVAGDDAARIRMGKAARERVERDFDVDRWVERTIDLYERVLQSEPAPVRTG